MFRAGVDLPYPDSRVRNNGLQHWLLARGLYASLFTGARAAFVSASFGLAYVLIAIFGAMALLKAFVPRHVGYFIYADGSRAFGIVAHTDAAREALGWWVVPVALCCVAALYIGMTRALAGTLRRRHSLAL